MAGTTLDELAPTRIGNWESRDVTGLVAPKIEGGLSSRLYNQTIERVFTANGSGPEVMVLLAHGDTQSNDLQLHRPEVCYPAFGFVISSSRPIRLALAAGAMLPARSLVAEAPDRRENIVYWTRLGEYLPNGGSEQRLDRIETALAGDIADGLLARFSLLAADSTAALTTLEAFVPDFVRTVAVRQRRALIGTRLGMAMAAARA